MTRRIVYAFLSLAAVMLLAAVASQVAVGQDLPNLRQMLQLPEPIPHPVLERRSVTKNTGL